ncbi:MAG: DUF4440 domain-containing protein, partial [Planctomycetota bacterium]|nr:DUF4440 domain-containing protein [Planctomycetota bacterium]
MLRVSLLSLLALGYGCVTPAPLDPLPAVAQVLDAQQQAWNRGDLKAFMHAGYLQSTELTFFSGTETTSGFAEVLRRYQRSYGDQGKQMGELAFSALETFALGPRAALARGRWRLSLPNGEEPNGLFSL